MIARVRPILASAIAAGILTGAAEAAPLGGGHDIQIPLIRMLAAFVICALAALVLALVVKALWLRNGAPNPRRRLFSLGQSAPQSLNVLETRMLGPQASVSRIAYDDLEFLVLVSAQNATLIHQKPAAGPIEAEIGS